MILGRFLQALAELINILIHLYIIIIIIRSVISFMPNVRPNNFILILRRLTDPVFRWVHKKLPFTIMGGIDISPMIIVFGLYFINTFITGILFDYANMLIVRGTVPLN